MPDSSAPQCRWHRLPSGTEKLFAALLRAVNGLVALFDMLRQGLVPFGQLDSLK